MQTSDVANARTRLEATRSWVLERFDHGIMRLLQRVDHTLYSLAQAAVDDPMRPIYFDVMRDLRIKRDAMRGATEAELSARLGAAFAGRVIPESRLEGAQSALFVDSMAARMRTACREMPFHPGASSLRYSKLPTRRGQPQYQRLPLIH